MNDDKLKLLIQNVLSTSYGLELFSYFLDLSNCFSRGTNFNNVYQEYYNKGKKDFGHEIAEMIKKYSFDNYIKILKERNKDYE